MRASEILRHIADVIDRVEGGQPAVAVQQTQLQPAQVTSAEEQPAVAKLMPVNQEPVSATQGNTFVPPLQSKIELLKKAVDVDSIYDQGGDELAQMKKMAGIHPVVADEAGNGEPLDV